MTGSAAAVDTASATSSATRRNGLRGDARAVTVTTPMAALVLCSATGQVVVLATPQSWPMRQKKSLPDAADAAASDAAGRSFVTAAEGVSALIPEAAPTSRPALLHGQRRPCAHGRVGVETSRIPQAPSTSTSLRSSQVPVCHFVPNTGTRQTPTFQRKMVAQVPVRPSGPSDSGQVPDRQVPPFFADEAAKRDLDPSLKLLMRGRKEKGIRGGGTERRFHSASLHGILLCGRHSRHLFGRPCDSRCARSPGLPHPRRWRSSGPHCVASLLALQRHVGGVGGCLPKVPLPRCAPPRTPSADHVLTGREAAAIRICDLPEVVAVPDIVVETIGGPMAAEQATEQASERKRVSIPRADESVLSWWDAQHDAGLSVRMLIRAEIERSGYVDVAYRPLSKFPSAE